MKSAGENSENTSGDINLEKVLLIEDKLWSLVEIHRSLSNLNPVNGE